MSIPTKGYSETGSSEEDAATDYDTGSIDLAGIMEALPGDSDNLLISNLLAIFGELASNPDEKENWDKMERFIDERLDKVTEIIEEYNNKQIPTEAEEIHYKVLDAFALYYEGLFEFKDLLFDMDVKNVKRGFDLIFSADNLIMELEEDMQRQVDDMVITTII